MKKWLFASLFAVLMLTGCMKGNDTTNTAYDLRNDNVNPNFMSNGVNQDMGPMSDQNPNFLNLRGTSPRTTLQIETIRAGILTSPEILSMERMILDRIQYGSITQEIR